ncbi:MOSC domain-containing protein [Vulgatibacter sp.]|uniref:MOSC domain-containing protein n=1 Tax=Vulgatibacter sp. TaxID=1971226 RepID=UPI00356971DE
MSIRIVSLRVGLPRSYGTEGAADPFERPWISAIAKEAVDRPLHLGREGLEGDGVADTGVHGGPEKAVLAGPGEHLAFWRELLARELEGREDFGPGAFGENLVLAGALEGDVCIGDSFAVGGAVVQISQPRAPCWKQARRWRRKDLALQMQRTGFTGWYFRVLREGLVAPGDELRLIERPLPAWTVARAHEVMHGRPADREAAAALAALPQLAGSWRERLGRLAAGEDGSTAPRLLGSNED